MHTVNPKLAERYPEIAFYLTLSDFAPQKMPAVQDADRIADWCASFSLEQIEVLYIYGIGPESITNACSHWLHAQKERRLIFIEDDLAVLGALECPWIDDPQVFIRYLSEEEEIETVCEELTLRFPSDRIATHVLPERSISRFEIFRKTLLRKTTVATALFADILFGHKLYANVVQNFLKAHNWFNANRLAGQFQNVPAIICGAGPSLAESAPVLKECGEKVLVLAGGSAFTALSVQGILPHLGIAFDPNPEEYERLLPNWGYEVPLIVGNRVYPKIFNTLNGPIGYLRSQTGGGIEEWLEAECGIDNPPIGPDLDHEAMSVTTLAIALAYAMGCNPIILTGVDLAYTGNSRYAPGVMSNAAIDIEELQKTPKAGDQLVWRTDRLGNPVLTQMKWIMESDSISRYALARSDRQFINASSGGIGFQGLDYIPLKRALELHCQQPSDLRGKIHSFIQSHPMPIDLKERAKAALSRLQTSLQRCAQFCDEMLLELERLKEADHELPTGKMVILEVDFQEEPAFEAVLSSLGPVIDRIIRRGTIFERRDQLLERWIIKWSQYKSIISNCLNLQD